MSQQPNPDINLFKSLFKGREDVFAIRWEKDDKSGYMPAYDFNWTEYSLHKANGGTLRDFTNKQYSKLTDDRIRNHLTGKEVIGVYPLLPDNTSWFIVADFDEDITMKKSWSEECKTFTRHCAELSIPAYLERSRSGKGGHMWIFFEENYPAHKSRKMILHILETTGIISPLNKNSNYDRLFPNQDFHSGKGLGNLIALPLQHNALMNGNSCFIDPDTLVAFPDQWEFLRTVKKISVEKLDQLFQGRGGACPRPDPNPDVLNITLSNRITILRQQLTGDVITFLRENLNFINSDYIIKKKLGRNTFGTERYFMMMEEKDGCVIIPKGFAGKLIRFIRDQKINYELIDERKKLTEIEFSFNGEIYDHQLHAIEAAFKKDLGIFVAPPGSGKTIIGLAIIAQKKQPALIIVHRKQLFDQWIERVQSFLGIAEVFIGKISSGQHRIGNHITVAMIQSLATVNTDDELFNSFGTIIVDECHHVPAKTFREVISNFNSFYQYGLTATPIRKNNDEKLIFIHLGDVIHQIISPKENGADKKIAINIRETELVVPFDVKTDLTETLSNVLIHDSSRNRMIVEDVVSEVTAGRKVLILTERKAHIDTLYQYLKNRFEVICLSGDDVESLRKTKLKQIAEGHFQLLISTGQFLGEGSDIEKLDCLVLAYPFSFEGKLIQYIGRVQRGEITPVIYDYRDRFVDYLEKMFLQRNRYYKKLVKAKEIKKFDEITLIFNEDRVLLARYDVTLSVYNLDLPLEIDRFRQGVVWNLRVLDFNEESAELITEILDYRAEDVVPNQIQTSLSFMTINKIRFRSIDTSKFLQSVHLKPIYLPEKPQPVPVKKQEFQPMKIVEREPIVERQPIEKIIRKKLKIPFDKIDFMNALVSFPVFIDELGKEITFEIENADIRPEFGAIKSYFIKILKKKEITTDIEIHYLDDKILSSSASSEDIARINRSLIDNMRFEFVKKNFLSFKGNKDTALETFNTLTETNKAVKPFFNSEEEFIEHFLNIESAKHYFQLRYLAAQHQSSVLKIRFILNPFSFIFLLAGNNKYHVIWETLNSEEATYIWHFDKSMEALRKGLSEIEEILKKIKATSKLDYLRNDHPNFSRIIHEYGDARKGFMSWKGVLEERLG